MKNIEKGIDDELTYPHYFDSSSPIFHAVGGITFPHQDYEMQRMVAPCYIFEYIVRGRCAVQIDDKIFTAEAGDVIIFPPGTFQHFYSDKNAPIKKLWVVFNYDFSFIDVLIKAYKLEYVVHVKNVSNTTIPQLFENIIQMLKTKPKNLARSLELEIHKLIGELSDNVASHSTLMGSVAEIGKMHMDRMLNMHFTIDDICKLIGASRSQFFRSFKKEYGISPAVYVINKKIELSKKMLEDDTDSITDIAISFDFSSTAHYSNTFKKIVGCTPLEYRKRHKKTTGNISEKKNEAIQER